jgi:CYTH domain-containing protein
LASPRSSAGATRSALIASPYPIAAPKPDGNTESRSQTQGNPNRVRSDERRYHTYLVLTDPNAPGGTAEERTEIPRSHAESLLDVCTGKIGFERTRLQLRPGCDLVLSRFVQPAGLNVLTVVFSEEQEREAFEIPAWIGPEVSDDVAWARHSIALNGPPHAPEVPLTNRALNEVLDILIESGPQNLLKASWPAVVQEQQRAS